MRRRLVVLVLLAGLVLGSCGGDDGADTAAPATGDRAAGSGTEPTDTTGERPDQTPELFGVRYCEVLAITVGEDATEAEVWGTQGLNDCPQAAFDSTDPEAVASELGVTAAVLNGPRYWVLDRIVANELVGSGETRTLGDLEVRSIAVVDLGQGVPDRRPYSDTSVRRDTEFVFDAGRQIYELVAPDGSTYVMQSYSVEVDPTLTVDDLAGLGDRLDLPDGWSFATRVLDDALVVEDVDGIATVIQDDLHNSYQLRAGGS